MKPQNELALIVAYYLSRLDKQGYQSLGYATFNEATQQIGTILDVKPNTIKNMRDEFDPYHANSRIGWKKELRGSRKKVVTAFQDTDDNTLLEIIKEILQNSEFRDTQEYEDIHTLFSDKKSESTKRQSVFILRAPTGKKAEVAFIEYFKATKEPINGVLVDTRDLGCGYDFEIKNDAGSFFIEVKGLSVNEGGVLFTNKEWQTARKYKDRYFLVLVRNIAENPKFELIQNPTTKLKAKKNIYTTIQLNWAVGKKDLNLLLNTE